MSIPEPEFSISVYQLDKILEELGYDWKEKHGSKRDYFHLLKRTCFNHLDTIQ